MGKIKPVYFLTFQGVLILNAVERVFFFLIRGPDSDLYLISQWLNISASRDINPDLHRRALQ